MKHGMKVAVAAGFVGVVALAATAFAQTGTPSPGERQQRKPRANAQRSECGKAGPGAARAARRMVHSEAKVQVKGGFAVVVLDVGTITEVNGSSVTIKRADGQSVTAAASDQTKVCKDGKKVALDQLAAGDRAGMTQVTKDGEQRVRAIRAHSPNTDASAQTHPAASDADLLDELSA
jgi:hypothetical protein